MFLKAEKYFALAFHFGGLYQIYLNLVNVTTRRAVLKQMSPLISAHPLAVGDQKVAPHPPPLPTILTCLFIFPFWKQPDVLRTTESAAHPKYLLWVHCPYCDCSGVMWKPLWSLRQKKKQKRLPLKKMLQVAVITIFFYYLLLLFVIVKYLKARAEARVLCTIDSREDRIV